jgi:hypothetical protein
VWDRDESVAPWRVGYVAWFLEDELRLAPLVAPATRIRSSTSARRPDDNTDTAQPLPVGSRSRSIAVGPAIGSQRVSDKMGLLW